MTEQEEDEIIRRANELLLLYGCRVTGIGPDATGVMGDAKARGPALTIGFPADMSMDRIAQISTKLTNEIREVTRVLMDVLPS